MANEYRRLGVASNLMKFLEDVSENTYNAYFVDLFVRVSNAPAIAMYKSLGNILKFHIWRLLIYVLLFSPRLLCLSPRSWVLFW